MTTTTQPPHEMFVALVESLVTDEELRPHVLSFSVGADDVQVVLHGRWADSKVRAGLRIPADAKITRSGPMGDGEPVTLVGWSVP